LYVRKFWAAFTEAGMEAKTEAKTVGQATNSGKLQKRRTCNTGLKEKMLWEENFKYQYRFILYSLLKAFIKSLSSLSEILSTSALSKIEMRLTVVSCSVII